MNKTDLWDAINRYCVACGGSPATRAYGNVERQRAVVAVEKVICETTENAMRKVADAARELLAVTGEIDDDGQFNPCPQSSLTGTDREAIAPWVEEQWRALSALVGCVVMRTEYLSPPYVAPVPCSVTGVRAEDNSSPGSAYRGIQRTGQVSPCDCGCHEEDECSMCGGDPYVQPCPKCKATGHEGDADERD